jgi:hypothetical protein
MENYNNIFNIDQDKLIAECKHCNKEIKFRLNSDKTINKYSLNKHIETSIHKRNCNINDKPIENNINEIISQTEKLLERIAILENENQQLKNENIKLKSYTKSLETETQELRFRIRQLESDSSDEDDNCDIEYGTYSFIEDDIINNNDNDNIFNHIKIQNANLVIVEEKTNERFEAIMKQLPNEKEDKIINNNDNIFNIIFNETEYQTIDYDCSDNLIIYFNYIEIQNTNLVIESDSSDEDDNDNIFNHIKIQNANLVIVEEKTNERFEAITEQLPNEKEEFKEQIVNIHDKDISQVKCCFCQKTGFENIIHLRNHLNKNHKNFNNDDINYKFKVVSNKYKVKKINMFDGLD